MQTWIQVELCKFKTKGQGSFQFKLPYFSIVKEKKAKASKITRNMNEPEQQGETGYIQLINLYCDTSE